MNPPRAPAPAIDSCLAPSSLSFLFCDSWSRKNMRATVGTCQLIRPQAGLRDAGHCQRARARQQVPHCAQMARCFERVDARSSLRPGNSLLRLGFLLRLSPRTIETPEQSEESSASSASSARPWVCSALEAIRRRGGAMSSVSSAAVTAAIPGEWFFCFLLDSRCSLPVGSLERLLRPISTCNSGVTIARGGFRWEKPMWVV